MKNNKLLLIASLVIFASCSSVEKTIKQSYRRAMYIDYEFVSFQGTNQFQHIYLEIDSTQTIWYWGKIIINKTDTINIKGFEKGGHYPTWYMDDSTDTKRMIEIWCNVKLGVIPKEIEIMESDSINGIIKQKTTLYRQPRMECNSPVKK